MYNGCMKVIGESGLSLVFVLLGVAILLATIFISLKIGRLAIPAFFLPKTSQQIFSGNNCANQIELWQRNICYVSAATKEKDASICEKIIISVEDETSSQNKVLCYVNVARVMDDPKVCEQVAEFRDYCLSEYKK